MKNIEQFDSMPLKRLVYCESINDVMRIEGDLERIYEGNQLWFRGVSKAFYRLKPSIQRSAKLIADQFGRFADPNKYRFATSGDEYLYLDSWKLLSKFKNALIEKSIIEDNKYSDMELLFIGQHYGLPTPLLDWTEDIRIALWFATEGVNIRPREIIESTEINQMCELSEEFAAIYVMPPAEFNKIGCAQFENFYEELISPEIYGDLIVSHYLMDTDIAFPVAIKGKPIDKRLINQKGNFTIHGYNLQEIDYIGDYRKMLTKIIIPHYLIKEIRDFLQSMKIDKNYVYGDRNQKDEVGEQIKSVADAAFKTEYPIIQEMIRGKTLKWGI